MMRITETVKQLIIINVLVYIGSQIVGAPAYDILALHFPANPDFKIWQVFTHMFMHASLQESSGITHIAFNMIALWMFGSPLEHFWGAKKFIFFYISCGLGAALLHMGVDYYNYTHVLELLQANGVSQNLAQQVMNTGNINLVLGKVNEADLGAVSNHLSMLSGSYNGTVVGASGAIYGVMVAFAFMFPNIEMGFMFLPFRIPAKYFVGGIIAFDTYQAIKGQSILGDAGDGIAHFAHLGGALTGFFMMLMWRNKKFKHNRWN